MIIHNSEPTVGSRIKAIASFLRLPQRLIELAKSKDEQLYLLMEKIYLNGDVEKLEEYFGDTKESSEEAFNKYWYKWYNCVSEFPPENYEDFSNSHPEYPFIHRGFKE